MISVLGAEKWSLVEIEAFLTASESVRFANLADGITVSPPNERVDLEALKATKARRKGAER
jgi:hypothetical protein